MINIHIQELLQAIVNGELDAFRKQIIEAFKIRDRNKNLLPFDKLQPGMKVKLVGCKKEVNGATGTILSKLKTTVMVELDKAVSSWPSSKINCIPGQLEVIKK